MFLILILVHVLLITSAEIESFDRRRLLEVDFTSDWILLERERPATVKGERIRKVITRRSFVVRRQDGSGALLCI